MPLFAALDRLKADLDALRPLAPEQEQRVLQKFRLDWNYHSNAIEGNSLTLGETRSLLLHGLTAEGKPLRDHLDIKGHNEAILGLEEVVHDDRPLTEQFIREMHQVLLGEEHYKTAHTASGQPTRQRIVPGQYKTSTNNVVTATGETYYFASPEETPAKMHDLLTWYRQETETPTLHPVALAAEFHHRFVSIHPFDDGNGRMSRLLMNLILMRHGYPITVIKADEPTRNRYLAALSAADAGDPEPFLRLIVENVEASLQLMIRAAKGESIEEPSDLDKKLALLKKQLLSKDDFIEKTWHSKTQTKLYETILQFWLSDFGAEMSRFNDLFLGNKISFHSIFLDEKNTAHSPPPSPDIAISLIAAAGRFNSSQPEDLMSQAMLLFRWDSFRGMTKSFSQTVNFFFVFKEHHFNVFFAVYDSDTSGATELVLQSEYKAHLENTQIHEINYQLANKVYDFIAAKVAEADSFPS
jgi:Fic family protein